MHTHARNIIRPRFLLAAIAVVVVGRLLTGVLTSVVVAADGRPLLMVLLIVAPLAGAIAAARAAIVAGRT
jgi:hypothetical protein